MTAHASTAISSGEGWRHASLPVYTAQLWEGQQLVSERAGLTYAAARHFTAGQRHWGGLTGRILCTRCPWVEVYWPDGTSQSGHFAQVTRVTAPPPAGTGRHIRGGHDT